MENISQKDIDETIKQQYLKLSPFNQINTNYRFTACVGTNGGYDQSTIYEGFVDAVNTLIESIGDYSNTADSLVYPILFCMRHSFELFLKGAYESVLYIKCIKDNKNKFNKINKSRKLCQKINQKIDYLSGAINNYEEDGDHKQSEVAKNKKAILQNRIEKIQNHIDFLSNICFKDFEKQKFTHDLSDLMKKITEIYDVDIRIKEAFDKVLPLLKYYKDIDPKGDAFKYWFDKAGNPHFETKEIGVVKIDIIAVQFEEMSKLFYEINLLIWSLKKEYDTGTFTRELSRAQLEEISKLLPLPDEFVANIKKVKAQIKAEYGIGSNKFNEVLDIIRRHREFSANIGIEKKFSNITDNALKILAECSLNQKDWIEASKALTLDELNLLFVFSDIVGWRYQEKNYSYFSEDLSFLHWYTKTNRRIQCYNINPEVEVKHIIRGMEKCGQKTYAETLKQYIGQIGSQEDRV